MTSRPVVPNRLLFTIAPLAIAAGFAYAAHSGVLCSGNKTEVKVIAKTDRGTKVEVYRDGKRVRAKKRQGEKLRNGVNPKTLGTKIYRAMETHWVPRRVVRKLAADPGMLKLYGDLVPVRECSGMVGFRIENTVKEGIYRRLGFRDGDLITAIDDVRIDSRRAAIRAVERIETADQVTVTTVRDGKTLQKTFLIES
jgi:type II secretory pathway component PulC